MTLQQQQFLELLKAGMWGKAPDSSFFIDSVDWKQIYKTSMEQAVLGLIADGIELLPKEFYPSKEILTRFIMSKVQIRKQNLAMNREINKIVDILHESGIRPILLKGQGIAQYYINPESRSCGDIDIYVGIENYNKCCSILLSSDKASKEKIEDNFLHLGFSYNGIELEIHRKAGYLKNPELDASFQKWTIDALDNRGEHELPIWNNEGKDVTLPDHTYNAFFLIQHIAKHITSEGIGFRQICDWIMFIHRNHTEIDRNSLQNRIREYRMSEIWNEFCLLAIKYLGLPIDELPIKPTDPSSSKSKDLLKQIFMSGNFGRFDSSTKKIRSGSNKKKRNIQLQIIRLFKIVSLFPRYTVSYGFDWLVGGVKRFLYNK